MSEHAEPEPTTTQRRTTVKRVDTKRRIVAAAIPLFARGGYEGTSIAAIAAQVGITDAGLLYHFPTKRDLFSAVIDEYAAAQADGFSRRLEPGGLAAIRNLADWGAVMEERPDLLALQTVLNADAILPEAELHTYWASRMTGLLELIGSLFRTGIERGEIRADIDAGYEAQALVAHLDGARLQWFLTGRQLSIDASFRTYVEHLVARIAATGE